MKTYLCQTCANREIAYVLRGQRYSPEMVCVYEMSNFPMRAECEKYERYELEKGANHA